MQTLSALALCAALAACDAATPAAPAADAAAAPADAASAPAAVKSDPLPASSEPAAPAAEPAPAPAASADVLKATEAQLKKGMAYGDFRKVVLAQGWEPVPTAQCRANVIGGAHERICAANPDRCKICDDLPELDSCSGDGHCLVRFKHAGVSGVLQATGYGEVKYWNATGKDSGFSVSDWGVSAAE